MEVTDDELKSVKINGDSLEDFQKENSIKIEKNTIVLGSGKYLVVYSKS